MFFSAIRLKEEEKVFLKEVNKVRRIVEFLILIFTTTALLGCVSTRSMFYDPPIPTQNHFKKVEFELYIYDSEEEFQKALKFYEGKEDQTAAGFTIKRLNGKRIVVLPRDKDDWINLWSLGHEVLYHVIYDSGGSHQLPRKDDLPKIGDNF